MPVFTGVVQGVEYIWIHNNRNQIILGETIEDLQSQLWIIYLAKTTLDNFNYTESPAYYNRMPAIYRFSSGVKYI